MGKNSGPVISPHSKERITDLVASAENEGGKIMLDGRNLVVSNYPDGNFVGPTIIKAETSMRCYKSVPYNFFSSAQVHKRHIGKRYLAPS